MKFKLSEEQRQKAYLKYKRRVDNRQVLYLKRRRIYGK